ncbi:ornithine cyclodeaminase [Rehaibacterium terrae]|jgi:ornithine cyclodeaminase|uniref:Ornithine cyclodeaminase n=1 Tax=Rehaibacterium terrae TaxID=1341696 RepID=A0A7W7XXZ4_9GAMM|nr:ornithine cyclodeaminase [Rehaibacterium terrae]MBB5014319.1 ornithine cyclodeaminase [Rehaibacterium terrae]
MTTLLTTRDIARIVATLGLPHVLARMVDYIDADFRRWPEFEKCARLASHSDVGVIELMPVSDAREYSFKYVNGHPKNTREGLPTVMAFGVLADVDTGKPTLLSELTLTTAIRTAATSVLAARVLARKDARTMALIGNGAQSEFQALAFHHLLGIEEVRLFDVDPAATTKLASHLAGAAPALRVLRCADTAGAVRGADIVTTVTADKTNATILTPDMLVPGMHINGVGGDCPGKTELHREVLARASVFVEFEPQTRIEGDLQQMPADFAVTELWRVLTGAAPGRRRDDEITVFDSVGFALEDYSALRLLRDCAGELGLGETIGLIPALDDPKDLYGHLLAEPVRSRRRAA